VLVLDFEQDVEDVLVHEIEHRHEHGSSRHSM